MFFGKQAETPTDILKVSFEFNMMALKNMNLWDFIIMMKIESALFIFIRMIMTYSTYIIRTRYYYSITLGIITLQLMILIIHLIISI